MSQASVEFITLSSRDFCPRCFGIYRVPVSRVHSTSLLSIGAASKNYKPPLREFTQSSEIAADIQTLSHELHSTQLAYLGIAAAMQGFSHEFGEVQKVEVDFKTPDLPSPLSPDISLCLCRVLQEALHNSVKHTGAL